MGDLRALLIGGPPGAGKTTLARSLGAKLGFLATTVDDLVSTARMFTDAESQPDKHPIVLDWWLFNPDKVAVFCEGSEAVKSVWLHIDPMALEQPIA